MNLDLFPYAVFDSDFLHVAVPAAAVAFVHPGSISGIVWLWRWIRRVVCHIHGGG